MASNLFGFTIISFILNQSIAGRLSCFKVDITFSAVFSAVVIVLASAKFNKSLSGTQRYKSLLNMLNKSGLSIEPWGTPGNRI